MLEIIPVCDVTPVMLRTISQDAKIGEAIHLMNKHAISQIPVVDDKNEFVGSLNDSKVLKNLIENPQLKEKPVKEIMDESFQFVGMDNTLDVLSSLINKENKALLVRDEKKKVHIITQSDLLMAITN